MKKMFYMKQDKYEPNSYNVYEFGRVNQWGEPYCVHPQMSYEQAKHYVDLLNRGEQK